MTGRTKHIFAVLGIYMFQSAVIAVGQNEVRVYFGNLHAHSNASDGNKNTSPREAYQIARDQGHLDFLSLSEHNHIMENQNTFSGVIQAAEQETTTSFVALYGQEYSTIKKGFNHTNIHNYPVRLSKSLNGKYRIVFGTVLPTYVAMHPDVVIVAGFNHPMKLSTDYGLQKDYNGDWDDFVADMDPFVQLIAVASGPADANNKSFIPQGSERHKHQNISKARWFEYLSRGMHLAPKIDHDSHAPSYGFRHAGRTAVWIKGDITRKKLLRALANRHCYATEDPNLRIVAEIDGSFMPGDILQVEDEATITLVLFIEDDDEPNANYEVEIFSGITGDGIKAKEVKVLQQTRQGNGTLTFSLNTEADLSLYYITHITQESNDPINAEFVQDAWLAPIWLDSTEEGDLIDDEVDENFVSSKRSKVYHFSDCRVVNSIKPYNLREHEGVPDGKRLHQGCPW